MLRRRIYEINTTGMTDQEIWIAIRTEFGPVPDLSYQPHIDLMAEDLSQYLNYSAMSINPVSFKKWLLWKITTGSLVYGNLAEDTKNDHTGKCFSPCPYDTDCLDLRTRQMLKLSDTDALPAKVDHSAAGKHYYLEVKPRGAIWGYECTFSGCIYLLTKGKKYFFI